MRFANWIFRKALVLSLVLGLGGTKAWSQTEPIVSKQSPDTVQKTFYLNNVSQQDATEVITALRNMLDARVKIFPVMNQNAIVLQATPDQQALAQRLLNDLDRPKKTYRLVYTVAELEGDKSIGTQHFAMIVVAGQRTTLKQGSKIPVITGTFTSGNTSSQNQATYLDVGMNFDASLDEFANGVRLRTKVEQSSVAEEKSGLGAQDPIIRQTVLEGTSFLSPGKPLMLGSVDVPGSTRHLDVSVMMELVR